MSGNIIHLVDQAAGMPATNLREVLEVWATDERFDPGNVKTIALIAETDEGHIRIVAHALGPLDGFRTVGLLNGALHKVMHGGGFGL